MVSWLAKSKHGLGNVAGLDVEAIPHGGASVGTVMTLARAGGILRLGRHMTGFGPDTIEPGGAMLQNMRRDLEPGRAQGLEWYGFVGLDHRLVAHNIFLDGTVFRDSPSVQRRPHVYDLSVGFSLRIDAFRLSLTRVRRSEEFFTPASTGGRQTFDSVNLGFELNLLDTVRLPAGHSSGYRPASRPDITKRRAPVRSAASWNETETQASFFIGQVFMPSSG
jgi:hypothetical protein